MTLAADLGAGLELGPVSIQAITALQASVNTLATTMKAIRDAEEAYAAGGLDLELGGQGTTAASNVVDIVIGFGGEPRLGRMWELRSLAVSGTSPETSVSGTAYLIRSAVNPIIGSPMGASLIDIASSLPDVAFYSSRQVVVHNPSKLFVVISGGTASTQYVMRATVLDVPDIARKGRVDL